MSELLLAYSAVSLLAAATPPIPWPWLVFGFCGQACFTARFLVQWIHSERLKESRIPDSFWWFSIAGSSMLLIYFIYRRDPVGMLGYAFNLIPYTRNLILIHRKRRAAPLTTDH